jgi:hypothetical protein
VYQLLPIYKCIDLGEGYVRPAETNDRIAGLVQSRAAEALAFHDEIVAGTQQHAAGAYAIHSVVGISQKTQQSARLDGDRIVIANDYGGDDSGGDGTVPRVSATPVETSDWPGYQPMYSSDKHGSLQNAEAVQTQLTGILTAKDTSAFRDVQGMRVDTPDLLELGEPLEVTALPDRGGLTLAVTVVDMSTGRNVHDQPIVLHGDADEVHTATVPPLPSGDYRVVVAGVGDSAALADPVHSLLSVFDDIELDAGVEAATPA